MHRSFNLSFNGSLITNIGDQDQVDYYIQLGKELHSGHKKNVSNALEEFLLDSGSLDGSEIMNNWFPTIKADIFLSHSHADSKNAHFLAGWLYSKADLIVFIDSCVWGQSAKLLQNLDDNFCYNEDTGTYDYQKRNQTTSHVHSMLLMALAKMIDATECAWLLNTPYTINSKDAVDRTKSPWIFAELLLMNVIRESRPARMELAKSAARMDDTFQRMNVSYGVNLAPLAPLTDTMLQNWMGNWTNNLQTKFNHPLDCLYDICDRNNKKVRSVVP